MNKDLYKYIKYKSKYRALQNVTASKLSTYIFNNIYKLRDNLKKSSDFLTNILSELKNNINIPSLIDIIEKKTKIPKNELLNIKNDIIKLLNKIKASNIDINTLPKKIIDLQNKIEPQLLGSVNKLVDIIVKSGLKTGETVTETSVAVLIIMMNLLLEIGKGENIGSALAILMQM
jgi:hypothetical protein